MHVQQNQKQSAVYSGSVCDDPGATAMAMQSVTIIGQLAFRLWTMITRYILWYTYLAEV